MRHTPQRYRKNIVYLSFHSRVCAHTKTRIMAGKTPEYNTLMSRRIHRILLICNSYDSYALEEDGHIEAQLTSEYAALNLSNPPSIDRVESTMEALELLQQGSRFDLIITMYNVGELDVFSFSRQAKELCPSTPVVLLTSYSKEIYQQIHNGDNACLDYVFCWSNATDLIIAIIKLFEDSINAEHDIAMGVQAILLVEDSIRYYSTYLPMLYRMILEQNNDSIREALNEYQQTMRKRARPKILMATNYDDAVALYDKYKDNLLGVISDVGFVMHKGENSSQEKLDAGINLVRHIRSITPKMPILMQSSQESMREQAEALGVGFVKKNSPTLTQEIAEYMGRDFGFGDFVLKNPNTGVEIYRVHNLAELEHMIQVMPDENVVRLAATNLMSKWLKARGLFALSDTFFNMNLEKDGTVEAHRKALILAVRDFRINQALGVLAQYDKDTFNDAIWFVKAGRGSLGGKARGLAFMNHMLQNHKMYDKWEGVRVLVPRTLVVTTEYFDRFIKDNGLSFVINSNLTDDEILSEFVSATLPAELMQTLRAFVRCAPKPIAIRSSSILEDSYYQPFAGVYSTYMIPHTDNEDQQLRLLSKAIKSVYASVYFASSRSYITATGNVLSEEKMAVIVQEVCGSEDQGYFFPTFSGVARSLNFYPIGHEAPEEGIAKLAFGLGKAVVDGDQVLRFSPKYPRNVLQTSTMELTMTDTQKTMYALDLQPDKFKTSVDDAVNLALLPIEDCTGFRNIKYVASTLDRENLRIVDSTYPQGPKFITFAQILKYKTIPLAEIVAELLETSKREIKCDIEIEFACNMDVEDGREAIFNVLQIRPISVDNRNSIVDWNQIDCSEPLIASRCALGTGWIQDVKDVVYIKKGAWDVMKTNTMAHEITKLNEAMQAQGRQYVLIGYGRWGSSIPTLGIPVKWSDISSARVLVEASLENFRVDPSQGTHFFQNLTSFNAGYINIDTFANSEDCYDIDALEALPAVEETEFFRHVQLEQPLEICIDGRSNKALIKFGKQ